jgi:hypothetical protein
MKQLVIMPGGFHPFHAGHLALYQSAEQAFPGADVKVAATNDTSSRPFPFALKEKLAQLAGVPAGNFYQVKSPFRAEEITQHYDPADTQLIFVRSEKDANKPPVAGGTKKDGSPAYLQPISDDMAPMNQHAYMVYLPTVEFGPGMTSATEIRSAWPTLNDKRKTALVMSLYPKTQSNPALAANVVKMLDTAMGTEGVVEAKKELPQWKKDWYAQQKPNSWPKHPQPYHNPEWIDELPPEDRKKLANQEVDEAGQKFVDPELYRTQQYAKQHYPGMADPESAFDKWVSRSLMHSDKDDHDQDKRLQQLAKEITSMKAKIQSLQQTVDYLDESR